MLEKLEYISTYVFQERGVTNSLAAKDYSELNRVRTLIRTQSTIKQWLEKDYFYYR